MVHVTRHRLLKSAFRTKRAAISRLTIGLLLLSSAALSHAALEVGDAAPDFTLQGSDGKSYSLSDFRNKAYVVIAFFPKAFTGG